jgi:hypothetical protein
VAPNEAKLATAKAMINGITRIDATLRDMFDLLPAKLLRPLLRRNSVDDYAETAGQSNECPLPVICVF